MSLAIRTSQNVLLEYEPASIGERILAASVDYVVIVAWFILVLAVPRKLDLVTGTFFNVVVLTPVITYDLLSEWLLNGRSIGKIVLRIRVVMLDGSPPKLGAYLIRWLLRIVESVLFLGGIVPIITVAANGRGQRLGDIAAGTTVVKVEPAVWLDDVLVQPVTENYTVQFPDVRLLTDRDVRIVRHVLSQGDESVLLRTANKIKEVTGIQSDFGNRHFLQTVINDYQFITTQ